MIVEKEIIYELKVTKSWQLNSILMQILDPYCSELKIGRTQGSICISSLNTHASQIALSFRSSQTNSLFQQSFDLSDIYGYKASLKMKAHNYSCLAFKLYLELQLRNRKSEIVANSWMTDQLFIKKVYQPKNIISNIKNESEQRAQDNGCKTQADYSGQFAEKKFLCLYISEGAESESSKTFGDILLILPRAINSNQSIAIGQNQLSLPSKTAQENAFFAHLSEK